MSETIDQQIARRMAESNAQISVTLSGATWKAVRAIIQDYKPGNDRNKRYQYAQCVEAEAEISAALAATNADLRENGGY